MKSSENIQNIFINTLSFNAKKFRATNTDFSQRLIMGNVDIFPPFGSHSKYLAQFLSTMFSCLLQCIIPIDSFISAMY